MWSRVTHTAAYTQLVAAWDRRFMPLLIWQGPGSVLSTQCPCPALPCPAQTCAQFGFSEVGTRMYLASLLGHSSGQLVSNPAHNQEEGKCHQLAAGGRACVQGREGCRWSALEGAEHGAGKSESVDRAQPGREPAVHSRRVWLSLLSIKLTNAA